MKSSSRKNINGPALLLLIAISFSTCNKFSSGPTSPVVPPDPLTYNFHQGNLSTTGNLLDLGIDGDGFFILKNGPDVLYYRRPGSFFRDKDGYFVQRFDSIRLQGMRLNDTVLSPVPSLTAITDIKIPISLMEKQRATSVVKLFCNLDGRPDRTGGNASITVYDHAGSPYALSIAFEPTQIPDRWDWHISMPDSAKMLHGVTGYIRFCADGSPDTIGFDDTADSFAFSPVNTADTIRISIDIGHCGTYTGITNFNCETTVKAKEQDGYPAGLLSDLSVDQSGVIAGIFTNGVSRGLFQIPIANFPCREGLKMNGNNYFFETEYSGVPTVDFPAALKVGCIELAP